LIKFGGDHRHEIFPFLRRCVANRKLFPPPTMLSNGIPAESVSPTDSKDEKRKSKDAAAAAVAVLKPSIPMPSSSVKIQGVDFNNYSSSPITVQQLTSHYRQTGFQATNLGRAIEIINNMVSFILVLCLDKR